MSIDLTDTIAPKSDQLNADDLLSGPRTFTIVEVRKVAGDQPVSVVLQEFPKGRPFKPCKSMLRVLVHAWGADPAPWAGRRLTLYRDPRVRFGGEDVGGLRISHLSHIDNPLVLSLTVTRGKRAPYRVEPLPTEAPTSAPVDESTVAALAELRAEWKDTDPERKKVIEAEVKALQDGADQ